MSLYERYELLDLNRDIGVKTFEARELATGRPVKVHLFVHPSAPLQAALLKAIDKLPEDQRQRIIERGKHEGTPYVVTDRLADYPGLSEWVQAAGHAAKAAKPLLETAGAWKLPAAPLAEAPIAPSVSVPAPPAPPPVPATVSPLKAHSELNQKFTELFATAERPIVADSLLQAPPSSERNIAAPLRPPEPPLPAAVPPPQAQPEPGEFTRMFQSPVVNPVVNPVVKPVVKPVVEPAATPLPPSTAPQAQASPPAPAQSAPPAPPAAKEAGEFTRMFQAPAGYGAPVSAAPAPTPAPTVSPAAAKSGPGEFTRFFQTPSPAGPMPQSPVVQQPLSPQSSGRPSFNPVSEFTRTFGKGTEAPTPPPAMAPQQEPGEFTRMFHSPAVAGSPAGAAVPPTSAQPSSVPQATPQPLPPAMGGATRGFSIPTPAHAAPQPGGPGEYTRQFSAPAQLTFGQTSATPPGAVAPLSPQAFAPPAMAQPALPNMAPASAPPRKSNLPLILGIVGLIVVAALLILFFALRPK